MAPASADHRLYARNERDEMQKKSDDVIDELVQITDTLIADKEEVMKVLSEKDKELENEKQLKDELHEDFIQLCHDITEVDARRTYVAFQIDAKRQQVISLSQKQKELTVICAQNEKVILEKKNALEEAHEKHVEEVALLKMEYENRIHAMEVDLVKTNSLILEKDKELEKEKELKNECHHNFLTVCHNITEKDERNATLSSQLHDKRQQVLSLSQKQKELTVICAYNEKLILEKENALQEAHAEHRDEVSIIKEEYENIIHEMEVNWVKTNAIHLEKNKELEKENAKFASLLEAKQKELSMQCAEEEKVIFKKQNVLEDSQGKDTDEEVAMIKMKYDYRMHAMENIIDTKIFEIEEIQINLEEVQEEVKGKQREIEKLICQRNNWKAACKQSEYGYEILRKKHEDSKRENELLRKIKDEKEFDSKRICNEDNSAELKDARMLTDVDSGYILENKDTSPVKTTSE